MLNAQLMREIENRVKARLKVYPVEFQSCFQMKAWMETHLSQEDALFLNAALEGYSDEDAVERWLLDIFLGNSAGIKKSELN